jgi:ABC-2 type transport system ATP-binding protein
VTATSTSAPIRTRSLSKTYKLGFFMNRAVRALQGLDLTVAPGQIYGLLGPNGAGKSTTIKILLNLVRPSSGEATLFGLSPESLEARRQVGFVPENPAPYEYLTGREFVSLAGRLSGLSGHELDQRVREVLGKVEIGKAEKLPIRRYSKGMVQRIALAQGLVGNPKLLILDEPTSGLDPIGRRQMRDLIVAERARGTTILFCTHIIPDVEAVCDRIAVLVGGKLVREGSVQQLLYQQVPSMEIAVEGIPLEKVRALGVTLEGAEEIGGRVLTRTADKDAQRLLGAVVGAGGRVTRVQAARFSLEDLFINAIQESGRSSSVGGEITG